MINEEQQLDEKKKAKKPYINLKFNKRNSDSLHKSIIEELNNELPEFNFIKRYLSIKNSSVNLISTSEKFNLEALEDFNSSVIINLKSTNDISKVDEFFNLINIKLPYSGIYVGRVQTYEIRKKYFYDNYPRFLSSLFYFFDFVYHRIISKLVYTKNLYALLNNNKNKSLSRAETLGRLIASGFDILEDVSFKNYLYFAVKKVNDPITDKKPTNGVFISLDRIGKNGKVFKAYKIRTMHPYSEFLQPYIYKKNRLNELGKIKNDFRISRISALFRKYWIDEIPMLINLIRGDVKLVGVRPISPHFFSLYSKELQNLRNKYKPGLIPPYYVDLPKNMEEIMSSELNYLKKYEVNPLKTDLTYLLKSLKNVFIRGVRSK